MPDAIWWPTFVLSDWSNTYVWFFNKLIAGAVTPPNANLLPPLLTTVTASVCVPENIPAKDWSVDIWGDTVVRLAASVDVIIDDLILIGLVELYLNNKN